MGTPYTSRHNSIPGKILKSEMTDENRSENLEEDPDQTERPELEEGAEATDPYDIREYRYREENGRYYYDKGSTNGPDDTEENEETGPYSERYVKERDRVLKAASRLQTSDTGERERIKTAEKKRFPHFLENLQANFDPNPKPPFKTESPHEREGRIYLVRHKICELFQNATTLMLVERPDNPKQFLISHLSALMAVREGYPSLYDFKGRARTSASSSSSGKGVAEDDAGAVLSDADSRLPLVFNEDNIRATFSMMEPTNKGTTTRKKFRHALKVLGLEIESAEDGAVGESEDDGEEMISEETFVSTALRLAVAQAKTFYPRVMLEKAGTLTLDDVVIQE